MGIYFHLCRAVNMPTTDSPALAEETNQLEQRGKEKVERIEREKERDKITQAHLGASERTYRTTTTATYADTQ